jgi:TonB-dependent receptor
MARSRGVDTRRFKYFHKGPNSRDQDILAQDMESIFVPENIGPEGFQFEEFTRATDNYSASQRIQAAYAMVELPFTSWLRAMAGARLEHSTQNVETFELFNPDQTPVPSELDTTDLLPGATLTLAPVEQLQLRLGVARTVSRPEFRELSPATFNDVTGGRETFGNPDLERTRIDHLDVRLEWFPRAGEVFSISGFTKRLTDPIETIVIASAQQSVTWANAEAANNTGVELECRKSLPLNLFSAGNLALIRSRIVLGDDAGGIQTSNERALQGQSPYVVNLQLGWDHPERADQLTVLYNIIGKRITEVGALGTPDAFELPVHMLDLVARKDLGNGFALSLKGGNLLDATAVTTQGTEVIDEIRRGWRVGVGIKWSPE